MPNFLLFTLNKFFKLIPNLPSNQILFQMWYSHNIFITVICSLAFLWQLISVAKEWLIPTHSATEAKEEALEGESFPVIFKICPNPGFNLSTLNDNGYLVTQDYFTGKSMYNSSHYGWAGHYDGTSQNHTVEGITTFIKNQEFYLLI